MARQGGVDSENLDVIQVSPAYLEQLKECRDGLEKEARLRGEELATRLVVTFKKMKFSSLFNGGKIFLNEATLLRATISFWEDILRVKAYHPIDRAEKRKKAAYLFKWIAKMRPVKPIVNYPDELTNAEMNANAMYAFLCASGYLNCTRALPEEELHRIIYSATYREIHPDEWTIIFDYMERLYPA